MTCLGNSASLRLAVSVIQTRAAEVRQPCPFKHFKHSAGRSETGPEFIAVRIFIFIFTVFIFNYHSPSDFSLWPRLAQLSFAAGGRKTIEAFSSVSAGCAGYLQRKYETSLGQIFIQLSVWCKHGLGRAVGVSNEWCHVRSDWTMSQAASERENTRVP